MQAILDRVIVRPYQKAERIGSIILPEESKKRPKRGTIQSIGPGNINRETGEMVRTQLQPGDVVYYNENDGIDFRENGDDLVCILENDIIAKEE